MPRIITILQARKRWGSYMRTGLWHKDSKLNNNKCNNNNRNLVVVELCTNKIQNMTNRELMKMLTINKNNKRNKDLQNKT